MTIKIKRIYETPSKDDEIRILVDRLWPRGISKEKAQLDYWLKEIAPSHKLRKAFHHENLAFEKFKEDYLEELQTGAQREMLEQLKKIMELKKSVTLLFSAKCIDRSHAAILLELLEI